MFYKKIVCAALSALVFGSVISVEAMTRDEFIELWVTNISDALREPSLKNIDHCKNVMVSLAQLLNRKITDNGVAICAPTKKQRRSNFGICSWFRDNWDMVLPFIGNVELVSGNSEE
ncbi:MAG: ribosomal-processing cysteine protease Prp [Holosporaceae bacterium]|jgi:hypothetical protein|nr:ribosomal-processing cysteine protease Prp [Holosporaceae bacterium]